MFITHTALASAGISCRHVSVRPSVANRCLLKWLHDSTGTLVFGCQKSSQNSKWVTHSGGTECRMGRLNAGVVAENWQLSAQSIVNLVRLQVYHTERPPDLF